MEHIEYAYTRGMDDEEIAARLGEAETGVLALSNRGDAYATSLAHDYDGEVLYVRLAVTEQSTKQEFIETTETACYVLYGTTPTGGSDGLESWSIVVTGHLDEVPRAERQRFDSADMNRRFSPIRVFGEAIDDVEIRILELDVDAITGRSTPT